MSDECQNTAAELGDMIRRLIECRRDQRCCSVTALIDELAKEICHVSINELDAVQRANYVFSVFRENMIRRIALPSSVAAFKANYERLMAEREREATATLERQLGEFGIDIEPIRSGSVRK